jgi:hypothetical protein
VRRAPLLAALLLAAAAGRGARAAELPKYGVLHRPKGFSAIRVVSAPGLAVFLDDEPVGTTDALRQGLLIEDLPAGTYALRVEQAGYEPKVVKVTVAEGDTKEVRILGLRPKPTPTPAPFGPPPPPPAAPPPVRAVIFERKAVPGGMLVTGAASSPADVLPLLDDLKRECACTPALEEVKRRKDGLYEFRVKLPGK